MKPAFLPAVFLLLLNFSFAQSLQTYTTNVNGENRSYLVYTPAIYQPGQPVPLVFNFHGYGSNMNEQMVYGNFKPIADTANFIIVCPDGSNVNGQNGWNTGTTIAAFQKEINFVNKMLDELQVNYSVNPSRIYSTGMSNGGFMSYGLACFMSDKIAAIASVTGGMTGLFKFSCHPSSPTPVMQIHGTADALVNYNGSPGVLSVNELIDFWTTINGTKKIPVHTLKPDINTSDNSTAEWFVYADSLHTPNTVELFKINNGGHTWPGALFPVSGNTNMDINASIEIWRFFSQYNLHSVLATNSVNEEVPDLEIFPNPATEEITIKRAGYSEKMTLQLIDVSGRTVKKERLENEYTMLSVSSLPKGIYIYTAYSDGSSPVILTGKLSIE